MVVRKNSIWIVISTSILVICALGFFSVTLYKNKILNEQISQTTVEAKESLEKMRTSYSERLQFLDKVAKGNWSTELPKLVGDFKIPDEITLENRDAFETAQSKLSNLLAEAAAAYFQKKKTPNLFEFKSLEQLRELEKIEKGLNEARTNYHKSAFAQLDLITKCQKKFMCKHREQNLLVFRAEQLIHDQSN